MAAAGLSSRALRFSSSATMLDAAMLTSQQADGLPGNGHERHCQAAASTFA